MTELDLPPDQGPRLPWKRILGAVAILFLLIIGFAFIDGPEPHFPEFENRHFEAESDENPFQRIRKIASINLPDDLRTTIRIGPREPFPIKDVEIWVGNYDVDLSAWKAALSKPRWRFEEYVDAHTPLLYLNGWSDLMRLKAFYARSLELDGNHEKAILEVMEILDSGSRIQRARGTIQHHLTAITIFEVGHTQLATLLEGKKWTEAELREVEERLDTSAPCEHEFAYAFAAEYEWFSNTVNRVKDGTISSVGVGSTDFEGPAYLLRPNRTKQLHGEAMLDLYKEAKGETAGTVAFSPQLQKILQEKWSTHLSSNMTGHAFLVRGVPGYRGLSKNHRHVQAEHRLLQIRVAAEIHRLRTGTWPSLINEVYPEEVPIDPRSGKPFELIPNRDRIWDVKRSIPSGTLAE